MLTMGVAIAIPEPYGSRLRRKRASFGDQLAETVPSHVTLMPPLTVESDELEGVCGGLRAAAAELRPFSMTLRGTGTFRPVSPVVFVAIVGGVAGIEEVAAAVRAELEAPPAEFSFHPHVTIAHNIDDAALNRAQTDLSDFECTFQVDSFDLYLHERENGWAPKHAFQLGSAV